MDNAEQKSKIEKAAIMTNWSLLTEWFCIDTEKSEEEILADIMADNHLPTKDPALVKDRCFGGFRCRDYPHRRHVHLNAGAYTYIGSNSPYGSEERLMDWNVLLNENTDAEEGFIGGGPFCDDAPV